MAVTMCLTVVAIAVVGGAIASIERREIPVEAIDAELGVMPADPSVVIDRPSAEQVVEAWWRSYRHARDNSDGPALDRITTGAARVVAEFECPSGCYEHGDLLEPPYLSAPSASGFPASFLAQFPHFVTYKEDGQLVRRQDTTLVVFVRESAQDTWKAAIVVSFTAPFGPLTPSVASASDQFVIPVPADPSRIVSRELPQLYADYWDSWKRTGAPPEDTPFNNNGGLLEQAERNVQYNEKLASLGVRSTTTYRSAADKYGFYEFGALGVAKVVCSSVEWTTVDEPFEPGGQFEQPPDHGLFDEIVPPGTYARLELDAVRQACFYIDSRYVSVQGQTWARTAVRATPG